MLHGFKTILDNDQDEIELKVIFEHQPRELETLETPAVEEEVTITCVYVDQWKADIFPILEPGVLAQLVIEAYEHLEDLHDARQ